MINDFQAILKFPKKFLWGAATASYQVEGEIKNNDWYFESLKNSSRIPMVDNRINHYEKFRADFKLAADLNQNCQRISIEWARIEPVENQFDDEEIEHYRQVIREIKNNRMEPFVTLWHFTLPDWFYKKGGFANKNAPLIFENYCSYVLSKLGKEAKFWETINEPNVWASNGYLRGIWPPFKHNPLTYFRVLKNLAKSHNLVYWENKRKYNINIGVAKDNINFRSDIFPWSKIICYFTSYFWNHYFLKKVSDQLDHIGLNYYFDSFIGKKPKWYKNLPKNDMGWTLSPEGIFHVLRDLKKYNKPIYITEAGLADSQDRYREKYIQDLLIQVHKAILFDIDVRGFMHWSLLDNFEWAQGYDKKFGLVEIKVDGERKPRQSAYFYANICRHNKLKIK